MHGSGVWRWIGMHFCGVFCLHDWSTANVAGLQAGVTASNAWLAIRGILEKFSSRPIKCHSVLSQISITRRFTCESQLGRPGIFTARLENSWKKLNMLPDSFEVSTSTFDLCTPGDCYHSTERATVQPNHSRSCKEFLSDARASRTKCQTKKMGEELHVHVQIHHG